MGTAPDTTPPTAEGGPFADGMGAEGLDMLAQCVEANVRAAAWTTNALLDGVKAERDTFATDLAKLYDELEKIPDHSRSVTIERLLWRFAPARDHAARTLERDGEF